VRADRQDKPFDPFSRQRVWPRFYPWGHAMSRSRALLYDYPLSGGGDFNRGKPGLDRTECRPDRP
jgi:hypothetical protein